MHIRSRKYKTYCVIETQCDDDTNMEKKSLGSLVLLFVLLSLVIHSVFIVHRHENCYHQFVLSLSQFETEEAPIACKEKIPDIQNTKRC